MIGIIGAMQIEIENLKNNMESFKTEVISGIEYNIGKISGVDCVCAVSGVGKVNAAICTQTMILKYNPVAIINTGVAGGIAPGMKVGDIAIAENVMQHDMDTSAIGDVKGMISGINIVEIPCDKNIVEKIENFLVSSNTTFRKGTIATGDQFINDSDKLKEIRHEYNAIACEMEGGSIGQVCYINDVRFAVIRAISDTADKEVMVSYNKFVRQAADLSSNIVINVIKSL